jgi:hypothetical protein
MFVPTITRDIKREKTKFLIAHTTVTLSFQLQRRSMEMQLVIPLLALIVLEGLPHWMKGMTSLSVC